MAVSNDELRRIFAERYYHKRSIGIPAGNRKSSPFTDIQSGFAEKCAADYLGCAFNCEIFDGNDGGYDFLFKGYKVDVKWLGLYSNTNLPRNVGRIIVDIPKIHWSDIYIAVSGSEKNGFICMGWCTKMDLLNRPIWYSSYPDNDGDFRRYAIHTSELYAMYSLKLIRENT